MSEKTCTPQTACAESTAHPAPTRKPHVHVHEDDREVRITASMPGTDEDSLELTFEDGILTLAGTPRWAAPEGMDARWTEFELGPYERRFALRDDLDPEGITATVKDGVVELVIPRAVEEKRRIPITTR